MRDISAVTGSEEQCPRHDPMGAPCKNRKICEITYLKKDETEHYICERRCLAHGAHYVKHLVEKYELEWIKMEFAVYEETPPPDDRGLMF